MVLFYITLQIQQATIAPIKFAINAIGMANPNLDTFVLEKYTALTKNIASLEQAIALPALAK